MSPIDLHTHSTRSDGVLTPAELVRDAAAVGVRLLALTDHDTLAGVRDLRATGLPAGLELLAGVEINTLTSTAAPVEGEFHVLGLGVDVTSEPFEAVLRGQRDERRLRFERTIARLSEIGLPVDPAAAAEIVAGSQDDALGRPTIARLLVRAGHASSVQDAFSRLVGRGCPAYVPRGGLGPGEAIRAIRAAGGLPALAHFSEAPGRLAVVRELVELGLGGLEVYYRGWDQPTVSAMRAVADELGLVATGGSDYHGDTGTYAEAHAGLWVPPDVAAGLGVTLST
ncbi:MAG TPA: PHP domain-containing protein [Candidatus Limnocylindrales bacterium]|nr:PHP domain-containing protein [Candidatus Limnocylindrales bacterium]